MDDWGIGWARKNGKITSAFAPGHDRPRCVYVDFLNTGPAVSKTLRSVVNKIAGHHAAPATLRRRSACKADGEVTGAVALASRLAARRW